MNKDLNVLQLIDSLHVGGAERMSINIANALAKVPDVSSYLIASRKGGELEEFISPDVTYFCLNKKGLTDRAGLKKLWNFIKQNNINVIHAHGSSVFWALFMKLRRPKLKVVWHDHFGMVEQAEVRPREYQMLKYVKSKLHHYIVVNDMIKKWGMDNLGIKEQDITYLKNFAALGEGSATLKSELPGIAGKRIVCLANLRFQKDHLQLVEVARIICKNYPDWSFLCVGGIFNDEYSKEIKLAIEENQLENKVFLLGSRTDVSGILAHSTIGILTSRSEGLPVALLEYGSAGLPVVCTDVGQCKEVIDDTGFVIKHGNVASFADALTALIESEELREQNGKQFKHRIVSEYSEKSAVQKMLEIYQD